MGTEQNPTEQTPKTRIFVIDGREFDDPDPKMTVEEVRQYYVTYFPELSNAETVKTERDSKTRPDEKEEVYEFKRRVGVKGDVSTDREKVIIAKWLAEAEFRGVINAFQDNIENGILCTMVFDGKCITLSSDQPLAKIGIVRVKK